MKRTKWNYGLEVLGNEINWRASGHWIVWTTLYKTHGRAMLGNYISSIEKIKGTKEIQQVPVEIKEGEWDCRFIKNKKNHIV